MESTGASCEATETGEAAGASWRMVPRGAHGSSATSPVAEDQAGDEGGDVDDMTQREDRRGTDRGRELGRAALGGEPRVDALAREPPEIEPGMVGEANDDAGVDGMRRQASEDALGVGDGQHDADRQGRLRPAELLRQVGGDGDVWTGEPSAMAPSTGGKLGCASSSSDRASVTSRSVEVATNGDP